MGRDGVGCGLVGRQRRERLRAQRRWQRGRQQQRRGMGRATALEQVQRQLALGCVAQRQAQRRRGRFMLRAPGAADEHQRRRAILPRRLGCHLQAAQLLGPGLRCPQQQCGQIAATQRLLCRPQALGRLAGFDHQHRAGRNAMASQRRQIGLVRAANQHQRLLRRRCQRHTQRRQQQPPFVQAGLHLQQLAQTATRPAGARQLDVQRRMAAGHGAGRRLRQRAGTPEAGVKRGGEGAGRGMHTVYLNSILGRLEEKSTALGGWYFCSNGINIYLN